MSPSWLAGGFLDGSRVWAMVIGLALSVIYVSVSVAENFVHSQTAVNYGYHAFGELARFTYCLLQKIKRASSLPLVEQWDGYMLANHSAFPPLADVDFLAGTRVSADLNKMGSSYLRREFQRDAPRILEEFTNSVLSTVAARSKIGQGLSCFCPAIIIGGDDHAPLQILGLLLDGLLERGWIKGSEIEACRAEYQSFVLEQRQLERSSRGSRPDAGDVLSYCSSQAGFRARQHLFKVCIVSNRRCCFHSHKLSFRSLWGSAVSGVSANSSGCKRANNFRWTIHHQSGWSQDLRR